MALVTRNSLRGGRRAASLTALGVSAGIFIWAIASAMGVAVLLERSVIAFTVLKLAGAAYLAILGLRSLIGSFRSGRTSSPSNTASAVSPLTTPAALRQGLLGNLLNPKAGIIFVSVVPQFVKPGDGPVRLALMILAFEVMLLVWLNVYGLLISRAGRSRAAHRVRRVTERVTGVVLIGLGLRLASAGR
jgi:threonine/homoserine/homoserine lactone efflux protein